MSIILNGTGESLRVVLAAAPATTQLAITTSWQDQGVGGGDNSVASNGTTAVTAVAAPAASVSRWVGGVSIYNRDTAAATVTMYKTVSGVDWTIFRARVLPGCHIFYDNSQGWRVLDANGNVQTASNQSPSTPIQGTRNLIVNGDLRINQPVFAGGALAANTYGYDMWRTWVATGSLSLSADRSTITLNGTLGTVSEAPDAANAVVTVSVSNPSGPITVSIQPNGTTSGVSGVIPSGTGQQSVSLLIPSSITGDVYVLLSSASAVTFDGPSKRCGVQVEFGSFATAFERRPFVDELLRCQRYYWKTFDYSVAPIQNSGTYRGSIGYLVTNPGATNSGGQRVSFPNRMRTTPSLTFFNPAAANANWRNRSANADSGPVGIPFGDFGDSSAIVFNSQVSGDTAGLTICVHMTADARF